MSTRTFVVILLALICGTTAAIGIRLLKASPVPRTETLETTPVVVTTQPVARGQRIAATDIEVQQWPTKYLPPHPVLDVEECLNVTAVVPLAAGEPVSQSKLSGSEGQGLAALVPEGYRAYTIHTARDASNVAGFVMPGNRVDVLMTLRGGNEEETGGGSAVTLLQAVEILAVAQRLEAPDDNRVNPQELRSVTLLVTPQQANLLDLGQTMGQLTLSLRNPMDLAEAAPAPTTLKMLRYLQQGPEPYEGPTFASLAGQASDALTAIAKGAKALADRPPAPAAVEAEAPAEEEVRAEVVHIRTLRGRHSGNVRVELRK